MPPVVLLRGRADGVTCSPLNLGVISNLAAPFGGMKASGFGREGGSEGIHEYLETQ